MGCGTGYDQVKIPAQGDKITVNTDNSLSAARQSGDPAYRGGGDGVGVDVPPSMITVVNAADGGDCKIPWMEVYTWEKAVQLCGADTWMPEEILQAFKDYVIGIKGSLTTTVGGCIRSQNVALRQKLDLYLCQRPVRWFAGVPSPVNQPKAVDMCIFRVNSEDIYAGIEWKAGSADADKVIRFLQDELGVTKIRGLWHRYQAGVRSRDQASGALAIQYAIDNDKTSLTLVHKGNIMKFTEGAFKDWGYELAREEFGAELMDGGPWCSMKNPKTGREIVIKDVIPALSWLRPSRTISTV